MTAIRLTQRKANKYKAISFVDADGVRWHSKSEYGRWKELQLLERAGTISDLRRQVPYALNVAGGGTVGKVVVDYQYRENGKSVVEDRKGYQSGLSKWKFKHFRLQYGVDILITRAT